MTTLAVVTEHESLVARFRDQFETVRVSPRGRARLTEGALPDAFLLDASDAECLDLVAHLSTATDRPIVVLSGPLPSSAVSEYLNSGADAVVGSSGNLDECVARLRALTRRAGFEDRTMEPVFRSGDVVVYPDSRRVLVKGVPIRLTRTEFNLLVTLAQHVDQVVSHRVLMAEVWGPEYVSARHYLRVYVRRLREKIEDRPDQPRLLVAQRGKGYSLRSSPIRDVGTPAAA